MTRGSRIVIVVAAALAATTAAADAQFDGCMKGKVADPEIGSCAFAWVARTDTMMARRWQTALAAAGGGRSAEGRLLLDEQRAWIAFKERACGKYADSLQYGTMGRYIFAPNCSARINLARATYLKAIAAEALRQDK